MTTKPTAGAVRAAEVINDKGVSFHNIQALASIIDEHAGLAELVEAAQSVMGWYAIWQLTPDKSPVTASVFFEQLDNALAKAGK